MYLEEAGHARLDFPHLVNMTEQLALKYQYGLKNIAIESKSSGMSVIQALNSGSKIIHTIERELEIEQGQLILPVNPVVDKYARASLQSLWCEKGIVKLPEHSEATPWLMEFEDELFAFPNGANDDQVDSFSQLCWIASNYLEIALQGA
jgi:predicted phage terminase large subunit-like protein